MAEENETQEAPEEKRGGLTKIILFGVAGLVLLVAGIFVGPAILGSDEADAEAEAKAASADVSGPPIYQSLHPPLVVNFKDGSGDTHFMQVTMEVMSRDQTIINQVRDNTAVIRNALILLYGGAVYEEIETRAGKEKMLADGLTEIRRVMTEATGEAGMNSGIEAVYFTALVIQ